VELILKEKQFVVNPNNQQVYCPEHGRLDKTGTKSVMCGGCNTPITGREQLVNALHLQWHQKCFVCTNCKKPLGGQKCTQKRGKAYCDPCYEEVFRTKCTLCKRIIDGPVLEIGPVDSPFPYHQDCFRCQTCDTPLKGQRFFVKGSVAYCEEHAD